MITVTVKHHFSAGHRIPGLPGPGGKCTNLHGHTFGVEWTFRTDSVLVEGIEFAAVKKVLREWVNTNLDHGYILGVNDTVVISFLEELGSKHYLLSTPPTTEAIASEIATATMALLPNDDLVSVLVTEGPHNEARWSK